MGGGGRFWIESCFLLLKLTLYRRMQKFNSVVMFSKRGKYTGAMTECGVCGVLALEFTGHLTKQLLNKFLDYYMYVAGSPYFGLFIFRE